MEQIRLDSSWQRICIRNLHVGEISNPLVLLLQLRREALREISPLRMMSSLSSSKYKNKKEQPTRDLWINLNNRESKVQKEELEVQLVGGRQGRPLILQVDHLPIRTLWVKPPVQITTRQHSQRRGRRIRVNTIWRRQSRSSRRRIEHLLWL